MLKEMASRLGKPTSITRELIIYTEAELEARNKLRKFNLNELQINKLVDLEMRLQNKKNKYYPTAKTSKNLVYL
jgi:hypothetical protein